MEKGCPNFRVLYPLLLAPDPQTKLRKEKLGGPASSPSQGLSELCIVIVLLIRKIFVKQVNTHVYSWFFFSLFEQKQTIHISKRFYSASISSSQNILHTEKKIIKNF